VFQLGDDSILPAVASDMHAYVNKLIYNRPQVDIYQLINKFANNESSEFIDILLPVTFYFNPSTRLDNASHS